MADQFRLEKREGRVDIILSNPPDNQLDIPMMRDLGNAMRPLAVDTSLRIVTIRAESGSFSTGIIPDHLAPDRSREMIDVMDKMFKRLWEINAITLAVVDGDALGGGCQLAVGCDLVVASKRARFGQPEISYGLFAPMAAVVFPKLVGRNRTFEWLLTGDIYSADEAEKTGLVNRVYPDDTFMDEAEKYIAKFMSYSAAVISNTKIAMDKVMDKPAREGVTFVDMIYLRQLMSTQDANEGVKAYIEGRDPVWNHR